MTDMYPVRRAMPLPPQSCLQWNHSILRNSDFIAPWQALHDAFVLHQELCPGDFDNVWTGELGLPPPKLRHGQSLQVNFNEHVSVCFGDEYEPIDTWDTFVCLPATSSSTAPCTAAIARRMASNCRPSSDTGLRLDHLPVEHCIDHECDVQCPFDEVDHDPSDHADVPVRTCSIMEPFIQMARLPDEDAGGHPPGPGDLPPADRPRISPTI